jgi:hypothetical protein
MYCDQCSPTLTNCTFEENSAVIAGGGTYFVNGSPTLNGCTFKGNWVEDVNILGGDVGGGGMCCYDSNSTLINCTFIANSAKRMSLGGGGGMYWRDSSTTLTNCTFIANSVDGGFLQSGGGIFCAYSSSATLINCTFIANSVVGVEVPAGGGMYCGGCSATLTSCTFIANSAKWCSAIVSDSSEYLMLKDSLICGNYSDWGIDIINKGYIDKGGNIISDVCPPMKPAGGYMGDLNGDGKVDFEDMAVLANNWLKGI